MSSVANPQAGLTPLRPRGFAIYVPAAAALLVLGSALIARFWQQEWEYPVIRGLNAYARHAALLDRTMHALTTRDLLQGVPFVALIWFLWFDTTTAMRARILAGLAAAACAGALSRTLQLLLPTHLRPLHQPELGFVLPFGVEPDALNHYNSFPSDHGAVYFTLCIVIWQVRPRLAVGAFAWAVIIDLARVYEGYHFPSDITGSIGLTMLALWLFQAPLVTRLAGAALEFEQRARPWFYMMSFLATYLIATLFDDVRQLGRGLAAVLLHHDPFNAL